MVGVASRFVNSQNRGTGTASARVSGMRLRRDRKSCGRWWRRMSDFETRISQIAQVIGQLEDSQVPRNIRNSARDAVQKWLLNKDKEMDLRLGMTASSLDEIFNDANLPIHYGPLCLQIQTALEALLSEIKHG